MRAASLCSDGTCAGAALFDGTVRLWQLDTPGAAALFRGAGDPASVLATTRGLVGAGAQDGVVRLWLADTGEVSRTLGRHHGPVGALGFSADRSRFASGGDDGATLTFTLHQYGQIDTGPALRGHGLGVTAIAFAPDGTRLATASRDSTVRLWPLGEKKPAPAEWDALLDYLRASTSACLTPEQRLRHLGESPDEAQRAFASCEQQHGRL
jgi:WD40 repeat protein